MPVVAHWLLCLMNFNEAIKIFNANRGLRVKAQHADQQDRDLRNFAVFMRDCPIEDITDEHVTEWITLFKRMGYAAGTLIKKEEALIQFYNYWRRKGLDVMDPYLIPLTDKEYTRPRVCPDENYRKLLEVVPIMGKLGEGSNSFNMRNRAMITLMWNTGMRRTELAALNVSDLNLEKKLVTIKTAKSKGVKPFRTLPYDIFDNEAVEVLPKYLEVRERVVKNKPLDEPDALFFAYKTTKPLGNRFNSGAIGDLFAKISHKAGLSVEEYVNPHSMRHHYGHRLSEMKQNPYIVSQSLGHSSLQSSMKYTELQEGELVQALRG